MEDIIKINKLELASELANEATKDEMFSKGLIVDEDEMYREESRKFGTTMNVPTTLNSTIKIFLYSNLHIKKIILIFAVWKNQ